MGRPRRILLIMCMMLLVAHALQAGLFRRKGKPAAEVAASSAMTLSGVEVDGSRVLLRTNGAPAYTSYSPSPGLFVVDLTDTARAAELKIPQSLPSPITSIAAEEAVEMGNKLTRVTFRLSHPAVPQAAAAGNTVVVTMPEGASVAPAIVEAVTPIPIEIIESPAVVAPAPIAEVPIEAERAVSTEKLSLPKAKAIRNVETSPVAGGVEIRVIADGAMTYKAFALDSPSRLVVDITGAKNAVTKKTITVGDAVVQRVRIGQFQTQPVPVTRVVIDLNGKTDFHVADAGDRLRVAFGAAAAALKNTPGETATPVRVASVTPAPVPVKASAPVKPSASDVSQIPIVAEEASTWKVPDRTASKGAKPVIRSAADQAPPDTTRRPVVPPQPADDVFSDAAQQPLSGTMTGERNIGGVQRQFSGEPISLNLKDADIKDVLRTFAQLTGLNMAVDPGVGGSVTVDFVDVPWDQALDIILRQNGLTFILEGNVMRIGTIKRISDETKASRELADEERLNVPLQTVIFKLSYARAEDVRPLLEKIGSKRAAIIVDSRTNQLIISEIPQYLHTMRNLIDTLDVPTRQVVIEARIVETTKNFLQQYGFEWGFNGIIDPALGNGTGLVFPNRGEIIGGPFQFGPGNPILTTTFFDVLGTFSLDFALNALETEGFVKIVSAPRVTAQDNTPALIASGVSIPYQTRVNFTTTITYLNAVLSLAVTPQITEAGTIIMDVNVSKVQPATGLAIEGSAGTPLLTRSATTKLMVRDGGTTVIGGIYQSTDNNSQTRVPFLHQIPIIGNLFKSHNIGSTHDELLIFITPRIVRG